MPQNQKLKEKISETLREIMSASENRDWGREAHTTKEELETMRRNNDNDFLNIADQILALLEKELQKAKIEGVEMVELDEEKIEPRLGGYNMSDEKMKEWESRTDGYNAAIKDLNSLKHSLIERIKK